MKGRYGAKFIEKLIVELAKRNYEICEVIEGTLGYGYTICVPPEDDMYHFIIQEHYLNEWCSDHTIKRRVKLSKGDQELLDRYYERESEEVA